MALRQNVAGILQRTDGCVLIGERVDVAGAWQFPQGGVDDGESHEEALRREMFEEIGVDEGAYSIESRFGPYRYQFPEGRTKRGFTGQEQYCYLLPLAREELAVRVDTHVPEFRALRWLQPSDFKLAWVPAFKREVFRQIWSDGFGIAL